MENKVSEMPTMGGETAETPSATVQVSETVNETPNVESQAVETAEKMFSRSQVEALMKKRVDRSHQQFFKRYNAKDLEELDSIFEKSKNYDTINEEYGALQVKIADLTQENAFLRNNINPNRYADIKAYFKGSDIPFTEDALVEALNTHPEWLNVAKETQTTISKLGSESHIKPQIDEIDKASKLFGVNLR